MSEEIVTWAVVKHGCIDYICRTEELAKKQNEVSGGTVVKLTGEMPRPLRKVSTEVWINPCEANPNADTFNKRLGIVSVLFEKSGKCDVKARITMEELPE